MSYDRNIAEARRLARARARTSGLSHQQTLDEIARRSGRTDWKAFLADPCPPITGEDLEDPIPPAIEQEVSSALGDAQYDPRQTKASDPRTSHVAVPGRRRRWAMAAGASLLVAATAVPTIAQAVGDQSMGVGDTVMLSEQRRRASTTPLLSVTRSRDTVYTTVRPFRPGMRIAMMAIFDYRPLKPWPGQRYVMPALASIGLADSGWRIRTAGYPMAELAYHPVVRLSLIVDCRTGAWRYLSSGLADDFVSPLSVGAATGHKGVHRLSEADRTTLCSKEIMDQSDVLRNLQGVRNEPEDL